jgi:hypothetical protein
LENRERLLPWIKEFSPIEHVSSGDPPIFLEYPAQKTRPIVGQSEPDPTHSALYGVKLVEKLEHANVEAVLSYPGKEDKVYSTSTQFLIRKLADE